MEKVKSLQNIEINLKGGKFLARDRQEIIPEKISLMARITDLKALRRYKDNRKSLEDELRVGAERALEEFINEIDSGEFYSNIQLNKDFRARIARSLGNQVSQFVKTEFEIKEIVFGTFEIDRLWTRFDAHIKSQIEGECVIEGSFIITGDEPSRQALRERQKFSNEDVKNKIIETIQAWLIRFPASQIIQANICEPDNFERAVKKYLFNKIAEAYGVTIEIQNIKPQLINQSITLENIEKNIALLEERIIESIGNGASEEKISDLEKRKRKLEEYKSNHKEVIGQSNGSGSRNAEAMNFNLLLTEVNQLLLENKTS